MNHWVTSILLNIMNNAVVNILYIYSLMYFCEHIHIFPVFYVSSRLNKWQEVL